MADLRQQLIGASRALLILGWALVVAKVALVVEPRVKSQFAAPNSLGNRIAERFTLTSSSSQAIDDDTIQAARDVRRSINVDVSATWRINLLRVSATP